MRTLLRSSVCSNSFFKCPQNFLSSEKVVGLGMSKNLGEVGIDFTGFKDNIPSETMKSKKFLRVCSLLLLELSEVYF